MSHSVTVTLIADQEIELINEIVNIHDLKVIHLDAKANVVGYTLFPDNKTDKADNWKPGEGRFDADKSVFKLKR